MYRLCLLLFLGFYSISSVAVIREFPSNTIYATLTNVNYPQITIRELPGNWGSSLLGFIFLSSGYMQMSPASVIRDQNNNNQVQNYIYNLQNQPVAIQPDYQGRVWVIWGMTNEETTWVVTNQLNNWK